MSHLANEFGVQSELHGQLCVDHEALNGCKNIDSLKASFENVNIYVYLSAMTIHYGSVSAINSLSL